MENEKSSQQARRASLAQGKPLLYSTTETRRLLGGVGNTWLHAQFNAGRLRRVKLGTRTFVPQEDIERLIAESTQDGAE